MSGENSPLVDRFASNLVSATSTRTARTKPARCAPSRSGTGWVCRRLLHWDDVNDLPALNIAASAPVLRMRALRSESIAGGHQTPGVTAPCARSWTCCRVGKMRQSRDSSYLTAAAEKMMGCVYRDRCPDGTANGMNSCNSKGLPRPLGQIVCWFKRHCGCMDFVVVIVSNLRMMSSCFARLSGK